MKWTTEKPTKPGWYFYRDDHCDDAEVYYVFSATFHEEIRWYAGPRGEGGIWVQSWNGEWAGPLEEPEE